MPHPSSAAIILTALLLISCGEQKPPPRQEIQFRTEYLDAVTGRKSLILDGYSSLVAKPVYGSVRKEKGKFIYTMPDLPDLITGPGVLAPRYDAFTADSVPRNGIYRRTVFKIYFSSDPLSLHQWYISNQGLNTYDPQGFNQDGSLQYPRQGWRADGRPGLDLNVVPAWKSGATGKGVGVIVYDSGVDPGNPDLAGGLLLDRAVNFITGTYSLKSEDYEQNPHGTKVAGIIGARAHNSTGIRGIAYESTIIPWRYNNVWEDYLLFDFPPEARVFQNSVGNDPGKLINTEPFTPSLLDADLVFFLSKGNYYTVNYYEEEPATGNRVLLYAGCVFYQVNCAETPKLSTMPVYYPVLAGVSGVNALGVHMDYGQIRKYYIGINASTGSDVMFVGFNSTSNSGISKGSRGIFTTSPPMGRDSQALELMEPFRESPEYSAHHDFYSSGDPDNPRSAYTGNFCGTSAAAPMLSAVAALVRSVNPDLTWADTYDILIRSSSVDRLARRPEIRDDMNLWFQDGDRLTVERAPEANAAGFVHSNTYGFGLVDAARAVELARNYHHSDLQTVNREFLRPARIPMKGLSFAAAATVEAATSQVSGSTDDSRKVFAAVLELPPSFLARFESKENACAKSRRVISDEDTFYRNIYFSRDCWISDLTFTQLEIESPSGKISVIKPMGSMYLMMKDLEHPHRIESKAFYGEDMQGEWKIRAITSRGERWKVRYNDPEQRITLNRSAERRDLVTDVTLELYPLTAGETP